MRNSSDVWLSLDFLWAAKPVALLAADIPWPVLWLTFSCFSDVTHTHFSICLGSLPSSSVWIGVCSLESQSKHLHYSLALTNCILIILLVFICSAQLHTI